MIPGLNLAGLSFLGFANRFARDPHFWVLLDLAITLLSFYPGVELRWRRNYSVVFVGVVLEDETDLQIVRP